MKKNSSGMIDVSGKSPSLRTAIAESTVIVSPTTVDRVRRNDVPKPDVLPVARVAAIQAAKGTSRIIPYCHPVPIDFVGVEFSLESDRIIATVTVKAVYKTGVEMEALTGASIAALTIYDMLKPIDDAIEITRIHLISKTGGKSDFSKKARRNFTAAVLVISDSVSAGANTDTSGKLIVSRLRSEGATVADLVVVPDDIDRIRESLLEYCDQKHVDLVITTGGTGLASQDNTPEAMNGIIEREIPGIAEAVRSHGQDHTPFAMLSRGRAGVRGKTIIINLPGSGQAVHEALDCLFPGLLHAFSILAGTSSWQDHDKKGD